MGSMGVWEVWESKRNAIASSVYPYGCDAAIALKADQRFAEARHPHFPHFPQFPYFDHPILNFFSHPATPIRYNGAP
jgi:hypothetical protein